MQFRDADWAGDADGFVDDEMKKVEIGISAFFNTLIMTNQEFFISQEQKVMNEWLSADAWLNSEIRKKSKPFVLRIVNSPGLPAQSNVDLGNAHNNRQTSNNGQPSAITTTSLISGVTYNEFLAETESKPFKVGQILIVSTTSGQLNNIITIINRDANGKRRDEAYYAPLDPYQQLTDRVLIEKEFLWDGYTTCRFATVNEGATINIFIWKKEQFSALDILSGGTGKVDYDEQRIVRAIPYPIKK